MKKPEAVEVYESPMAPKRDETLGIEDGKKCPDVLFTSCS